MKTFENKAALVAATLTAGQIVSTKGYYTAGDGGQGTYLIASSQSVNEYSDHTLANGNVALLQDRGLINVLQYGAKNTLPLGFDSQPHIQAALDDATSGDGINGNAAEVFVPAGNYGIASRLTVPSTIRFYGAGRFDTSINILDGFTDDSFIEDKGSAAKLQLEKMRFNVSSASNASLLSVVKLGYTIPFGTEGMLRDLLIRGGTGAGSPFSGNGLNIVGNVGYIEAVTVEYCGGCFVEGPNSVSNSYVNCTNIGGTVSGFSVETTPRLYGCHVEAPSATCIPFRASNTLSLTGCSVSLGDDNITEVIRMASTGLGINVNGLTMLRSGTGSETHMLNDQRTISSNNPYWADDAVEQGAIYNFSDAGYIRVGTASWITQDVNNSLQLVSTSAKGAVYTELVHNGDSIRIDGANNRFYPDPDNTLSLGYASRRFTEVFAVNATINTSDRREKTEITEISQNLKNAALEVKRNIKLYKWISAVEEKGDKARFHTGVIAQEVYDIFKKHGIDAFEHGFIGIDDIYENVYDKDGKIISTEKTGDRWSIRSTELMWLILSSL